MIDLVHEEVENIRTLGLESWKTIGEQTSERDGTRG